MRDKREQHKQNKQHKQNNDRRKRPEASSPQNPEAYTGTHRKRVSKASPARQAALGVIRAVRERSAFAQEVMGTQIDEASLKPEDRAFATRLVLGVVSSVGTLDEIIDRALRSPDDIQPDVRDALRLSVYEIIYMGKSPHAAVDQGVELVYSIAPRAKGVANAVLRKVVAFREEFPFGDPRRDIEALARLYAFPLWLAKRLVSDLGANEAVDFMKAANEPAPLYIAVNANRATDDEVCRAFAEAGSPLVPEAVDGRTVAGCYRVHNTHVLQNENVSNLLKEGAILVSDAASQSVASLVAPASAVRFLEIGAGRATKTILLQSNAKRTFDGHLALSTLDNHPYKTRLLLERAELYGAHVEEALTGNACKLDAVLGDETFDAVFIDAPCSGLGTLRRHPEIRWRVSEEDIARSAHTQQSLLKSAASHVRVGGVLAYATCTVSHEENNGTVKAFLESAEGNGFRLAPIGGKACFSTRLAPGTCDAHFAVRMERVS